MQEARVVRVPGVFGVQLPVRTDELAPITEDADRTVEDTIEPRSLCWTKICFDRLDLVVKGGEHDAVVRRDSQFGERDFCGIKICGIASLTFDAATEGHADQIAAEIVTPLMVDADVGSAIAAHLPANERAAVRAAIHERMQLALAISGHHDWRVANESRFEV